MTHPWPASPPEATAANFELAPGPGTTIASSAVWTEEAVSHEVAAGASMANTAATGAAWQGMGELSSATTSTALNGSLMALGAFAVKNAATAAAAVEAFMTAQSSVIPVAVCQGNRDTWAVDNAINPLVLGALTPTIVALDAEYFGEHWPHNASVGLAYSAALTVLAAALAIPPPIAPMGASPAAPAAAGAAVAQAAATGAAGDAARAATGTAQMGASAPSDVAGQMSSLASPMQSMSGLLQPLMGAFQAPTQAFQGLSSLPQSAMGAMGMFSSIKPDTAMAAGSMAEPLRAAGAGGPAAGVGAGSGAGGGGGGVGTGYPGAGLTNYTRPASSFAPEAAGRPAGLRPGGVLNAAELRSPVTGGAMGGTPMPMAPAGMLGRGNGEAGKVDIDHARIVVDGRPQDDHR